MLNHHPTQMLTGIALLLLSFAFAPNAHAGLILHAPTYTGLNNGLVGYWSFNGPDTTVLDNDFYFSDRSGSGNIANCTGCKFILVPGKIGQGYENVGGSDFLEINDSAVFNFNPSSGYSWSMWVNPDAPDSDLGTLVALYGDCAFSISLESLGSEPYGPLTRGILFLHYCGGSDISMHSLNNIVSRGQWAHVVVTYNPAPSTETDRITIYVDGADVTDRSDPDDRGTFTAINPVHTLIGMDWSYTEPYDGKIDEVRYYNRVLSKDEIKRLYNIGGTLKIGVSRKSDSSLNNGLVGYWTFDGPDMYGSTAIDRSGNENNGTLIGYGGLPQKTIGKIGQGLSLDGSDESVNIGDIASLSSTNVRTISAWIYPRRLFGTNSANFISRGATTPTWAFAVNNSTETNSLEFYHSCNTSLSAVSEANSITMNQWQHVAAVWDGGKLRSGVKIYVNGKPVALSAGGTDCSPSLNPDDGYDLSIGASNYAGSWEWDFDGLMDDVRIYNRQLSPNEIKRLYNIGGTLKVGTVSNTGSLTNGLVGYWSFDGPDMYGSTAIDRSGNSNNGTLNGAQTTIGKIGQGLSFDGTDDLVNITDSSIFNFSASGNYTWSYWTKPAAVDIEDSGSSEVVWSQRINNYGNYFNIKVHTCTDTGGGECNEYDYWGPVTKGISAGLWVAGGGSALIVHSTNNVLNNGQYSHVAVTYNASLSQSNRLKIYVNGADVTATGDVYSYGTLDSFNPDTITAGEVFTGDIDDFRFYNRVLSSAEIKRLYLQGGGR